MMPYIAHSCRRCQHNDTMAPQSSQQGSVITGAVVDGERVQYPPSMLRLHCGQCPPCKTAAGCDWDPVPGLRPQWYTSGKPVPDEVLYAPGFPIVIEGMRNDSADPRNLKRLTRSCACDACRDRYAEETGEYAPEWQYTGEPVTEEEAQP